MAAGEFGLWHAPRLGAMSLVRKFVTREAALEQARAGRDAEGGCWSVRQTKGLTTLVVAVVTEA